MKNFLGSGFALFLGMMMLPHWGLAAGAVSDNKIVVTFDDHDAEMAALHGIDLPSYFDSTDPKQHAEVVSRVAADPRATKLANKLAAFASSSEYQRKLAELKASVRGCGQSVYEPVPQQVGFELSLDKPDLSGKLEMDLEKSNNQLSYQVSFPFPLMVRGQEERLEQGFGVSSADIDKAGVVETRLSALMTQTAEADLKYCGPPAKKQAQAQERDNPAVTNELNKVIAGPGDSGTSSKKTSSGSGN